MVDYLKIKHFLIDNLILHRYQALGFFYYSSASQFSDKSCRNLFIQRFAMPAPPFENRMNVRYADKMWRVAGFIFSYYIYYEKEIGMCGR